MSWNPNKRKLDKKSTWKDLLNPGTSEFINCKKVIIMDCDGVISTGESFYNTQGKSLKSYGCYDKEMIKFLNNEGGWQIEFVTADLNGYDITRTRINDLHYTLTFADYRKRKEIVEKYKESGYLTLFIGDSISDIDALSAADFSACPNTSPQLVQLYCDYTSNKIGGQGAVGDILYNMCFGNGYIETNYK